MDEGAAPGPCATGPADQAEFLAWCRLAHTPGLSRRAARALLAAWGSPEAVLRAGPAAWRSVVGEALAKVLEGDRTTATGCAESGWRWHLGDPSRRRWVALGDPGYPPALLSTDDPPLLLYLEGDATVLAAPRPRALAIVGSRQASAQGRADARAFARELGDAGWIVVSGLAQGIDAAAHEGALSSASATVAVVGTGLDTVYPRAHEALAARIARHGVLVSEFPPGTPPRAEHFPRRNRLIATLSRGTLVVEAAMASGSLITARWALEAGREVFAIPGSIHAPQSRGCHALIRQGAKLVETVTDILEELTPSEGERPPRVAPPAQAQTQRAASEGPEDAVLEALGHAPATLDALGARTGLPAATLSALLLDHELAGRVQRLPGGIFQRLSRA